MADEEHSRSSNKKHTESDVKLWQELKIDFRLEAFKFPDNKIYGINNIIPESSRRLIKKFVLVVNKSNRIDFDAHYECLSASGFNTNTKNPSAYIEAIPKNTKWAKEPKTSKIRSFHFTGEVFALSPTISFDWSDETTDPKPKLVINWYHIGDKSAHKYILYLDDVEIQHIRQKLIDDAFHVSIRGFECGKTHHFQLVARLNNGKETYRSDRMEFTVPKKRPTDHESTEFITVLEESPPNDLPVVIFLDEDKKQEDFEQNQNQLLQQIEKKQEDFKQNQNQLLQQIERKEKSHNHWASCCKHRPHTTFPGIEHYLNNTNKYKQTTSSDENEKETDDDDDVIT